MPLNVAIKAISEQSTSSLTVDALGKLLKEANIPCQFMGYTAWGNFVHAQVLYVLNGVGYIASRTENSQDSSIQFAITRDGTHIEKGGRLMQNEIAVFVSLGLQPMCTTE